MTARWTGWLLLMSLSVACVVDWKDASKERMGDAGGGPSRDAQVESDARQDAGPALPDDAELALLEQTVLTMARWACSNRAHCEARLGESSATLTALCHPKLQRAHAATLRTAAAQGQVVFDVARNEACLAALMLDTSECDAEPSARTVEACRGVLVGTQGAASPCSLDAQCGPGLVCAGDTDTCAGRCAAPGKQGAACVGTDDCAPDFVCLESLCVSRGGVGLPCHEHAACRPGLFCAPDGKCAMQATEGKACLLRNPESCVEGLLCVQSEEDPDIATCGTGLGLGAECASERPCSLGTRCSAGRCIPMSAPGVSCNGDAQCPTSFYCGDNRCTPQPTLGEACDEREEAQPRKVCIEGTCSEGTCVVSSEGAPCRADLAALFASCEGYCAGDGKCVATRRVEDDPCAGSHECAEELVCRPGAPDPNISQCLPALACE